MNCEELGVSILSNNAEALAKFYEEVLGLSLKEVRRGEAYLLNGRHFALSITKPIKEKTIENVELIILVDNISQMKDTLNDKGYDAHYDSAHPYELTTKDPDGNIIHFGQTNRR